MKFSYLSGALGTPVRYSLEPYKSKTKFIVAAFLCCLLAFSFSLSQILASSHSIARASSDQTTIVAKTRPAVIIEKSEVIETPKPISQFDDKKMAATLDAWISSHKGDYSVAIADQNGKVLAEHESEKQYFMASIYKLYVAYVAYQKVDQGVFRLDEPYLDGWSRGKCLDEMIRTSHNACGEKMMAELGSELKTALTRFGFTNTSVADFTTSTVDANKILALVKSGTGLSESSKSKLLDSMLGQKYRKGLPAGLVGAKVYDKVGFRGDQEYHDVGIVELPDGRALLVSVFSNKTGAANIANLASTLSAAF